MKIKTKYKFILYFSAIWVILFSILELGHESGDMRGLGLYLGGMPFSTMDLIYPFWRENYFFRIVLLIFNSFFWGIAIGSCIILLKKIFSILKNLFNTWYQGK